MRNYKVKPINALSRGLDVLRALQAMRAASLHDLHQTTGLSKSTLTRIIFTLHRQGMAWQRMVDGAYLPSHALQQRAQLDDADWLVEIASPVLEELCRKVSWPSVLTVPRLDHMEVLETNRPHAYFDGICLGPIGFRANLLRSASGRAYLAFCPDRERETVLKRLRNRNQPGDEKAHDAAWLGAVIVATRTRGYSIRDAEFGGHYSKTRADADDGRNSIAMPIRIDGHVLGCVNLTWKSRTMSVAQAVRRHFEALKAAVTTIEERALREGVGAGAVASRDAATAAAQAPPPRRRRPGV